MAIIEWWSSLQVILQVFYCIAIPATLVLVVQTILLFIGMGENGDASGEVEVDVDADVDTEIADDLPDVDEGVFGEMSSEVSDSWGLEGLRIFTVRGIVAFFVVFGWVGVVMLGAGVDVWLSVLVSAFAGFLMMVALAYLFKVVMKLRNDGNTDNRNAIGTSGKVYLTIPALRRGSGKVSIMLQGAYVERNAVTDDTENIPTGAEIIVVGVSGQTDLIVRRK